MTRADSGAAYVLVLHAGASRLRFSVFRSVASAAWALNAQGQIDSIGCLPRLVAKDTSGAVVEERTLDGAVADVRTAVGEVAAWFRATYRGARLLGVGHHVAHGGTRYQRPTLVTPQVMRDLRELIPLAPRHLPHSIEAIVATSAHLTVPQVACFDTSFHGARPAVTTIIPLPANIRRSGLHRYGFHGLSYQYVAAMLPRIAPDVSGGRAILVHLDTEAGLCALKAGTSIDTTEGFSPLDGLCMGTRPGSLDPGVVLHLFQSLGLPAAEVEAILYEQSGLLALSGISDDVRELLASDAPAARQAVDYFVYRVSKEIGGLTAVLGGLDALVFTGAAGESSPELRRRICESCGWLGVHLDQSANVRAASRISRRGSRVSAWVIPTNEELMIASHTGAVLGIVDVAPTPAARRAE